MHNVKRLTLTCLFALSPLCPAHYGLGEHKTDLSAEEIALFDIPSAFDEGRKRALWSAEHMALCSRERYRSENSRLPDIPLQVVKQLSPDGMTLTTYTRYTKNGKTQYERREKRAVAPFVFMDVLNLIVDREEEEVQITIWEMVPGTRELHRIVLRRYNFLSPEKMHETILWEAESH